MVEGTKRVLLVDDHPLFRQGLAVALRNDVGLAVIGEVGSAEQALELARRIDFDIAVVDMLMPTTSGISLTAELFELQPRCRVLGLSMVDDPGLIADMLRARACGFAIKTQSTDDILDAIRQVLGGLRYLPPGVSHDEVDAELGGVDPDRIMGFGFMWAPPSVLVDAIGAARTITLLEQAKLPVPTVVVDAATHQRPLFNEPAADHSRFFAVAAPSAGHVHRDRSASPRPESSSIATEPQLSVAR